MLSELKLKTEAGSSRNACAINRGQEISDESDSESSNSSTDSNIKILEENFGKIDFSPKLQRYFNKAKPVKPHKELVL
jgi:hypothetical protein